MRKRIAKKKNETKNAPSKSEKIELDNEAEQTEQEAPLIQESNDDLESENFDNLSSLTLEKLANLALPYSNRSSETLKRLKREELIYIITTQKDDYQRNEFTSLNNDTKDLIELFIEVMNDIKMKRDKKGINAILLKILRKQDKKISEGLVKVGASGSIFAYSLCFIVFVLVCVDSLFGFENIVKLFKSEKNEKEHDNNNNK